MIKSAEKQDLRGRSYLFLPKIHLESAFGHYERALPCFPTLAPHARIGIDVDAIRRNSNAVEVFQLEAAIFEDMAALWNMAMSATTRITRDTPVDEVKSAAALNRATAKAAFNLIEGYLNGLALDIVLTRSVDEKEKVLLTEWDANRNRPRLLSLRDKLLQYPRIALAAEHPPFQESSCTAMKTILEMESKVRHALIHPTAMISPRGEGDSREFVFLRMSLEEVGELCDCVIELIDSVAKAVGPDFGDVSAWLFPRNENGLFPKETFT